jgi:hypothetical protein
MGIHLWNIKNPPKEESKEITIFKELLHSFFVNLSIGQWIIVSFFHEFVVLIYLFLLHFIYVYMNSMNLNMNISI